ncbi:MAG: DsbA family protein [Brevirhabdus sp.]
MTRFLATTALAVCLAAPAMAEMTEADVKRLAVEAMRENPQLVLDAILANPDVVMQAVAILREQDEVAQAAAAKAVLEEQRELLTSDPNAPVLGNPDGDVVVVEFFDYNCPYCKRAAENVEALIKTDPGIKVVYREWPILSEGSTVAARASLASRKQGLYEPFHDAMMGQRGKLNEAIVMKLARKVGLDVDQLRADMQAPEIDEHIQVSNFLAQALQFSGTPSFVIGDELVPGMVDLDQMQDLVSAARDSAD